MSPVAAPAIVTIRARRSRAIGIGLEEAGAIRREIDAALTPIAREHSLSVGTLLKLASVGGSAVA